MHNTIIQLNVPTTTSTVYHKRLFYYQQLWCIVNSNVVKLRDTRKRTATPTLYPTTCEGPPIMFCPYTSWCRFPSLFFKVRRITRRKQIVNAIFQHIPPYYTVNRKCIY